MRALNPRLHRLGEATRYLVDDSVGVIESVMELPNEAGSPNFFHFSARACNTRAFCPQQNSADTGGASSDRGTAAAKAIGEAVERYCSAVYRREDFPLSSFNAAAFPCVPPESFALYTRVQCVQKNFPYVPFDNTTLVRWAEALDVGTGEKCCVPAATVFVPYFYDKERGEFPILQPISTGLACHDSSPRAAVSAVCEVIERDAFTITWQARLARTQIDIGTLSDANRDLVARFESIGGNVTVFNLTPDHGIPVILSVLRNTTSDAPALVFAPSSHLDPEEAMRKSLEELAHGYRFCRSLKGEQPRFVPEPNFANVVDRDSHVSLYCDHANAHLADFVFASPERIDFCEIENLATGDPEQDLAVLVDRVESVNHRILLANVTTDDIRDVGLSVIRAVIPGFHPLCIGHTFRALGGFRLWEVPQKLGHAGVSRDTGDNPVPHPIP